MSDIVSANRKRIAIWLSTLETILATSSIRVTNRTI